MGSAVWKWSLIGGVLLALGCGETASSGAGTGGSAGQSAGGSSAGASSSGAAGQGMAGSSEGGTNGNGSGSGGSTSSGAPSGGTTIGGAPSGGSAEAGAGASSGGSGAGGAGLVDCDPQKVFCKVARPECPQGQVPSVEENCYGDCVKIDRCSCTSAAQCPEPEQYTCLIGPKHCSYYLK